MSPVAVLGSLNLDLTVQVGALPRPGETVLGSGLSRVPGGKGANQAAAAARLGASVRMVGRVGDDASGAEMIAALRADGVEVSGVTADSEAPSGTALILVEASGQNMIAVAPGANQRVAGEELDRLSAGLGAGDVVVLQLEIPVEVAVEAATRARRQGAFVILNAAPAGSVAVAALGAASVVVVNRSEAAGLLGEVEPDGRPEATARRLASATGEPVILTLGEAGAVLADSTEVRRFPSLPVPAVDGTGAGDALVGALAFAVAAGAPLPAALTLGVAAGAAAATVAGARASLPRAADLERLFGLDPAGLMGSGTIG